MASAECIEQNLGSITPSEPNGPESAHLSIEPRFLNVGYAPPRTRYRANLMPARRTKPIEPYPRLLLQGRWLEKAGFLCDSPVVVWVEHGCLIVELIPEEMLLAKDPPVPQSSDSAAATQLLCVQDPTGMNTSESPTSLEDCQRFAKCETTTQSTTPSCSKLSAKAARCKSTRAHRNSTLEQILMEEERKEHGYLFLAQREINAPAVCKALGTEIVGQRTALGMTAKQAYVRAELPPSYYYGIEGGSRQPSISVFLSVCEALAVHPREFWNRILNRMYYPDCTRSPEFVRAAPTPCHTNPMVPIGLR